MEERIMSSEADPNDSSIEQSLRPRNLKQYIGQDKIKANLEIFIKAAKLRQEALDHVLLFGRPD